VAEGGLKSALPGPGVFLPSGGETGFDGVLANIGDAAFPFGLVAHPTVEPFPLPEWAGAFEREVDATGGSAF